MPAVPRQDSGIFASLATREPFPGVRQQAFTTGRATVSRYEFAPSASFPVHRHPQEQITLIEAGSVEMTIAGQPREFGAGAWSVVEGDVEHGITAGDDGATVLAFVSPPRETPDAYEITDGEDR